jgi:hypothetical protein
MTPTPRRTASRKEEVENPPSTPEPSSLARNDFLPFVWQKLNDLDGHFADFCEKYGRVDARMESIDERLKETESRLSERIKEMESSLSGVRDDVRSAKVWITAVIAVVAALVGLYKLIGPHITWL